MKNTFIVLTCLLLLISACRNKSNTEPATPVALDTTLGLVIADTIIYEVEITNKNPEDTWKESCLKGLNHASLIDNIFTMIYDGKVAAYDHLTNEKLTVKQVEHIEKEPGFARGNISMIQFREIWYLNTANSEMTKKVISMVLGTAQYTNNGEFKGNKALFRVEM